MEKVRFGIVGTNFISDWVIAGARQKSVSVSSVPILFLIG